MGNVPSNICSQILSAIVNSARCARTNEIGIIIIIRLYFRHSVITSCLSIYMHTVNYQTQKK